MLIVTLISAKSFSSTYDKAYPIWETDFMLIKNNYDKTMGSKPVQNGVFTLS